MTVMRVHIDDTSQEDEFTWMYEGEPFTGEIADYDRDGNLVDLMTVVGGVQQGVERSWYSDGTLRMEIPIVDGRAVGTSRRWHPNGQLSEERDIVGGELTAVRRWASDGTPIA